MWNIVINMCEKSHYDQLRNDIALGNLKSDNNNPEKKKKKKKKKKIRNNVRGHWGSVSGPKNTQRQHKLD